MISSQMINLRHCCLTVTFYLRPILSMSIRIGVRSCYIVMSMCMTMAISIEIRLPVSY